MKQFKEKESMFFSVWQDETYGESNERQLCYKRLVCIVQKAPIHQSHVYGRIKILQTIF